MRSNSHGPDFAADLCRWLRTIARKQRRAWTFRLRNGFQYSENSVKATAVHKLLPAFGPGPFARLDPYGR